MEILSLLASIITGLVLGMIINILADTLPNESKPVCTHCTGDIAIRDYLLIQPCSYCGGHRRWRFWVIIVFFATLGAVFWRFPPERVGLWWGLILMAYFGIVFVIDMEHKLILRPTSIAGVLICGYLGWSLHGTKFTLLGGLAGFGIMLVLYYLGILFARGVSRRRGEAVDEVALGFGDVTLSFILGLLLGWPGISAGLLFGVLIGGLGSGIYLLIQKFGRGYEEFTAIPYAPFLLLSAAWLIFVLPVAP